MRRIARLIGAAAVLLASCFWHFDPYYYDFAFRDPYYWYYDADHLVGWLDTVAQARTPAIDLNATAALIAARAPSYYVPEGCVSATADGATVSYSFDGCIGNFSGKSIDRDLTLTLSQVDGKLTFTALATTLQVDGKRYLLDLTATATASGTQRELTVDSQGYAPEFTLSRRVTGTIRWTTSDPCIAIDSQGVSTFVNISVTSTIEGLVKCGVSCPSSGIVTVQGIEGPFIARYSGARQVNVVGPDDHHREFDLLCQ